MIEQCAGCGPRVLANTRILFEDSGRATPAGVAPRGLVAEHRELMAALDSARFVRHGLIEGVLKKTGEYLVLGVVMVALLFVQSRLASAPAQPMDTIRHTTTDTISHEGAK